MTTELAKSKIDKVQGIQMVEHHLGELVIFNTSFITPKTIDIMMASLDFAGPKLAGDVDKIAGHGILSIVIRVDGHPWGEDGALNSWRFYPDSKAAVCNIEHCIQMAIADSQNPEKENAQFISVYALAWKNIIQGFFHEVHHADVYLQDLEVLLTSKDAVDAEEELAPEFAREMMFALAKAMDVEPEFSEIVATMVDTALVEEMELIVNTKEAEAYLVEWAEVQKYMRDFGGIYYQPAELGKDESTVYLKTFKEFLHFCSGDDQADEEWNTPTIGVGCSVVQEPLMETATGKPATPTPEVLSSFGNAEGSYEAEDVTEMLEFASNVEPFDADEGPMTGVPGMQGVATAYKAYTPTKATHVATATTGYTQPATGYQNATNGYGAVQPTYGTGAVVMGAGAYPAITLPANIDPQNVINSLYLKVFKQVFIGCQYNPTNPAMPFATKANIMQPLMLEQLEAMFVKEMDCLNAQGQKCSGVKVSNFIVGYFVDKAGLLPGFDLTMSRMDGTQIKRRFIPQNPSKMKNGQYTATAIEAQHGNQILWVIDPDAKGFESYSVRVYNGVVQYNNNGKWA
jgi:hypothetical protein